MWCVLQSYVEAEAAIKAVLADPAALRAAAAPKKLPGAKDPADPDEGLPVSRRHSAALNWTVCWTAAVVPVESSAQLVASSYFQKPH